ncbi:MAG: efflux RND transporter permease subunit [Acidobacteriota bacterium]
MNRLITWFAGNPVAANLLMVLIMTAGALSILSIRQEVFPEFSLDQISVEVKYLGATPEEVEESVCVRIEEAIQGLDGIKKITSTASEGVGRVLAELRTGSNARAVLDDIKARVDAIDTFPEETEKPVIRELTNRRQVVNVAIWGDADEATLRVVAERVRDGITDLPGVSQVELANARPYEIAVEVSETALRRYALTLDRVARAIRDSSLDLPGGSLKTTSREILLRTKGQAYRGREFEDLVLLSKPDGTLVRLADVARVVDGFAETDQFARFDGKPAVQVEVFRTGDEDALGIATKVKRYLREAQMSVPEGIHLTTWQDSSKVLRDRLDLLVRNGRTGFILVFIILALFLRFRLAFWVSLGIPISFLGAFWMMPALGVSINLISLFAFIVVLGIVVDDAIVVGENVFTHRQRHRQGLRGAIEGAQEVALPVVFAVLTTVAVFVPLLSVPGTIGEVMGVIPLIVIPCLLFSLTEAMLILPSHLSHMPRRAIADRPGPWRRFQARFASGIDHIINHVYRPLLESSLRWRYLTLSLALASLIITAGLVGGEWIHFEFFPAVEAEIISAELTLPRGTPPEFTSEAVAAIERSAARLRREVIEETGQDPFRHVISTIGEHPYSRVQSRNAGLFTQRVIASHLGEVAVELLPAEERAISSTAMADRWRQLTGSIPDAVSLVFTSSLFSPGEDINVQFTGPNIPEIRAAAEGLKSRLRQYAGVSEVADSFREGKHELRLGIKPAAEALGLTLSDLAHQVRQAFYGEEAQRVIRGRDDIRVMVRYPQEERRSLEDLEQMRIRAAGGREIPFGAVAVVQPGRGYAEIKRVDRRRAVNVTAAIDPHLASTSDILTTLKAEILPEILAGHPGVMYTFEGEQAQQRDTTRGLLRGFALAILMVYALLAVPLRSYLQPLIIMSAIPFGLVGAVWGHILLAMNLTILSMFGIVAMAGVVVNDSLVMVDFINRSHRAGMPLLQAVHRSGIARFRPILLTSITTFAGLSPLMFEKSLQARFLIPMAISLAFGVLFATFVTLLLVPAGYMVLDDLQKLLRPGAGRRSAEEAGPVTAISPARAGGDPPAI